jgi:hypothetical protein
MRSTGPIIDEHGLPRFNEDACIACGGFRTIPCAQAVLPPGSQKRVITSASACCPECTDIPLREGIVPMRPRVAALYNRGFEQFAGLRWHRGRLG